MRTLPDPLTIADVELWDELQPWPQVLPDFLDIQACPGDECWGEVMIREGGDGGVCDQCALPVGECHECGTLSRLENDEQSCDGCDSGAFVVSRETDSEEVTDIHWMAGLWDH